MTKAELATCMAAQTSMSKAGADAAECVVLSAITDALAGGETVVTAGFGIFSAKSRLAPQGRNPRTAERIAIVASNAPTFMAGETLRDAVK